MKHFRKGSEPVNLIEDSTNRLHEKEKKADRNLTIDLLRNTGTHRGLPSNRKRHRLGKKGSKNEEAGKGSSEGKGNESLIAPGFTVHVMRWTRKWAHREE